MANYSFNNDLFNNDLRYGPRVPRSPSLSQIEELFKEYTSTTDNTAGVYWPGTTTSDSITITPDTWTIPYSYYPPVPDITLELSQQIQDLQKVIVQQSQAILDLSKRLEDLVLKIEAQDREAKEYQASLQKASQPKSTDRLSSI